MCGNRSKSKVICLMRLQVLEQFDTQIGWESVKKAIGAIITAMEANYDREMAGKMPLDIPLNCLMLGNPGTGKTTCAHLYGALLKATGFLSNGTVVSKTASDFVADVVGGSQVKTKAILTASAGKVLLIDEAYVLENNAFGAEVLNTLVEKIEMGSGQDLVVVMCGYEKQMRAMIRNQNPGLSSRFSQEFMFDDYNDAQVSCPRTASIHLSHALSGSVGAHSGVAPEAAAARVRRPQAPCHQKRCENAVRSQSQDQFRQCERGRQHSSEGSPEDECSPRG
jgi:hypothetical protein